MSADVIIGGMLAGAGIVFGLLWLALSFAAAAARRRPRPHPVPRKFIQCQQRSCTARATRIVLTVGTPMESMCVCDSDRDKLTRWHNAVDLGPIYRDLGATQ